ncbi:hypothetical protein GCM10027614_75300 [Micromonospora vulcania]
MIEPVQLPSPWRDAHLTVVVPTYNEAGNLPALVERLLALPLPGLRILVADDNSPTAPARWPTSWPSSTRTGSR